MKSSPPVRIGCQLLMLGMLLLGGAIAPGAETNAIRLAIGPFFAPGGNAALEQAAAVLPDLLTASLPQDGRFQLVQRDHVTAIWNEMHLAEAGLMSADNVVQLGRILSCDWLVSGTFSHTEAGPQIWVKVINTQDSVVVDLQAVPCIQTNLTATAAAIATFLTQAQAHARPKEFIALGRFDEWSVTGTHEGWSQRLAALLEKRFMAAGYGVVERDAVAPIFAEYQFQAAGLTATSTNQVKLKPAFWIVDGGCKWIHDTEDKLSVSIRVQKMGGGVQVFDFVKPAGADLEKAVVDTVESALVSTGGATLEQAQAGEEKIRQEQVDLANRGRGAIGPLHYSTNKTFITITDATGTARPMALDPGFVAVRKARAEERMKTLQQAILLNPKDMSAKLALGITLLGAADAAQSKQGADLLAEVAASDDAVLAPRAKNMLDDVRTGKVTFEHGGMGPHLVTHGQSASFPPADTNTLARGLAAMQARNALLYAPKELATPAANKVTIPVAALVESGHYGGVTVAKFWNRIVLIATGTLLQSYDLDTGSSREVGLPVKLKDSISAIEVEPGVLWLGTGPRLMRVSLSDGAIREFGEKDGFPGSGVSALKLAGGRLFIGFDGAMGYLETASGKFTGLMAGVSLGRDWYKANLVPPSSYVQAIASADGTNFLVTSRQAVQHFDFAANKWEQGVPVSVYQETRFLSDRQVSLNSKYMVVQNFQHCFSACRLPGTNWMTVNLHTNTQGLESDAVALDPANPDWLWIGNFTGDITLVDLATLKVLATGQIPGSPEVRWIFPAADKVLFLLSGPGRCTLRSLDKSTLFAPNPAAKAAQLNEITKVAGRSEHPVKITQNPGLIATLENGAITACSAGKALGSGTLLVACGTNLNRFDWSHVFGFGTDVDFEEVNLPLPLDKPITAIASDDQNLWLGTDGGGLVRIPQAGGAPTIFNEKDGFPLSSIRSLAKVPGRLMIGFGRGMDGAFGYLDTGTLKFTGPKPSGVSLNTGAESLQPPPRHSVWQIKSPDETNTYWLACDSSLYRLKFGSQEWSLQLPSPGLPDAPQIGGWRTLATVGNHVATSLVSGGVGIYHVSEDRWAHVNLSTNRIENDVTTLAIEADKPNYLWLGGHGKLTLLDMDTEQIVAEYHQAFRDGVMEFFVIYPGDIFFVEERSGFHELFHWNNPLYKASP